MFCLIVSGSKLHARNREIKRKFRKSYYLIQYFTATERESESKHQRWSGEATFHLVIIDEKLSLPFMLHRCCIYYWMDLIYIYICYESNKMLSNSSSNYYSKSPLSDITSYKYKFINIDFETTNLPRVFWLLFLASPSSRFPKFSIPQFMLTVSNYNMLLRTGTLRLSLPAMTCHQ